MIAGITGGFNELVHDGPGRGAIGISHAEVHHIELRRPRLRLHLVDDGKHVGGKLLDAIKLLIWLHLIILTGERERGAERQAFYVGK